MALQNGANVKELQLFLGHSQLQTTDHYLSGFGNEQAIQDHEKLSPVRAMFQLRVLDYRREPPTPGRSSRPGDRETSRQIATNSPLALRCPGATAHPPVTIHSPMRPIQ